MSLKPCLSPRKQRSLKKKLDKIASSSDRFQALIREFTDQEEAEETFWDAQEEEIQEPEELRKLNYEFTLAQVHFAKRKQNYEFSLAKARALEWKLQRNKEKEEVSKKARKKTQALVVAEREAPGDAGNVRREVVALRGAITTLTEELKEVNRRLGDLEDLIVAIGNNR